MDKEKEFAINDEHLSQKVIDPATGRDITGEYISNRLKELEKIADKIITQAKQEFESNKSNRKNIYKKAYWEIHEKLGMGSIGPATAAAGPLMEKKWQELACVLEINCQVRFPT